MMGIAAEQVITTVVSILVGGALGILAARIRNLSKFEKARIEIDKCTARRDIFDAYEDYIVRGKHMTVSRYDELEREFSAYQTLGGNGTAKKYMEEIRRLLPFLVID